MSQRSTVAVRKTAPKTVLDGSVCGDGAGPRTMIPMIENYILASADQVAIDAVASKIRGFDHASIKKIKVADWIGMWRYG